jgi:hypothetical protein
VGKLPDITGPDRYKPLTYNTDRKKFIYYDELIEGKERIVPLQELSAEQKKQLVIERNRVGSDYTMQDGFSGPARSGDDVAKEIEADSDFGKEAVIAELAALSELLKKIEEGLQ